MTSAANPSRFADLHLHTRYSDGTFTPRELVEHAAKLGFSAIAADNFFDKTSPDSLNGFLAVTDKTYLKECGSCHEGFRLKNS